MRPPAARTDWPFGIAPLGEFDMPAFKFPAQPRAAAVGLRRLLLGLALVFGACGPGWAAGLDGTTVSGYLVFPISASDQNWWDPASPPPQNPAFVPAPYLNHSGSTTVGISETDPEFGWCACGASHTLVVADFTDAALKVTSFSDFSLQLGWIETFTDTAFAGRSITKTFDDHAADIFGDRVTASLVGDVLTLKWNGAVTGCGDCRVLGPYEADFTFSPASGGAPEPSAWALMLLGFGLAGATLRGRKAVRA